LMFPSHDRVGGINKERAKESLEKGIEYLESKKIK